MKSVDVKGNHENMMKSNHGSENEGTCFLGDSLNQNISRKHIARLLNEESSSHLRCSEKQVLPKRIKAAIKRRSLK